MRDSTNGAELPKYRVGINPHCRMMQCDIETPKLAWNKLAQALKIICLWQEGAQHGLIYCVSKHGWKIDRLEESTKEADEQVAQQRFCIYFYYQIGNSGCPSQQLHFVLYCDFNGQKSKLITLWHQSLGHPVPGCSYRLRRLLLLCWWIQSPGKAGTKLTGHSIDASLDPCLFHVFHMDLLQLLTSEGGIRTNMLSITHDKNKHALGIQFFPQIHARNTH